ncbi:MAG TPA: ABC transporter permease [Vicinamibacteria bacterium]|nr:ABC transporter permease [Vicinamibacteria bacterium]
MEAGLVAGGADPLTFTHDAAIALRIAWAALSRNTLRATLTAVGITIGTSAVIATVAIGEGGAAQIHEQLLLLGDNLIWVEAGGRNVNGIRTGTGTTPTLVLADMQAILDSVSALKTCSPQVDAGIQVIYGNQNWRTTYRGVSPEYLNIRRWTVVSGDVFSPQQVDTAATVCLVGHSVATRLFGEEEPVGKTIRVRDLPFRVIGSLAAKGQSAQGTDQDDFILLPFTTAMRKLKGVTWLDDIMCSAVAPDLNPTIEGELTRLLRERHHVVPGQQDDFNIRQPQELIKAQEDMARTLTGLLAGVATISLVVGGVGIMNIMLVSVTERTREIGLRMAVGARETSVRLQFLAEAVLLCLVGSALGVLTGILASRGIAETMQWPMLVSPVAVGVAAASAIATGLVFGYYPARKASRQDPIQALRHE